VRGVLVGGASFVPGGVEQGELEPGAARGPVVDRGSGTGGGVFIVVVVAAAVVRDPHDGARGAGVDGVDVQREVVLLVPARVAEDVPGVAPDVEGLGVELGVEGRVERVVDDELRLRRLRRWRRLRRRRRLRERKQRRAIDFSFRLIPPSLSPPSSLSLLLLLLFLLFLPGTCPSSRAPRRERVPRRRKGRWRRLRWSFGMLRKRRSQKKRAR